ncbi:MAG: hypothetical protein PHD70_14215 [Anaerostipes sp.]|nr:hypothetical protein [Anaerostipes sp.]
MRDVGVLGVYTDQISNESQKKVKPILEELYKAICGMRLTKNEAKWLAFFIHSRISDANRESEKYELFNPVEVKDGVQMAEMCMRVDDVVYTSGITEVKVKISIDDSEMNKFIKKLKKGD